MNKEEALRQLYDMIFEIGRTEDGIAPEHHKAVEYFASAVIVEGVDLLCVPDGKGGVRTIRWRDEVELKDSSIYNVDSIIPQMSDNGELWLMLFFTPPGCKNQDGVIYNRFGVTVDRTGYPPITRVIPHNEEPK